VVPLIKKLRKTQLLTARGLLGMAEATLATGANPMALLRLAARLHPERTAIVDERERLRYGELWRQAEATALALQLGYGVRARHKVAIACRNHAAAIKAIFACSRLGAHIFLVNPEMSGDQVLALEERVRFDFFIYDEELAPVVAASPLGEKALPAYHPTDSSIDRLPSRFAQTSLRLKQVRAGDIVVMTSGTTGRPKAAGRRPSLLNSLPPFLALLTQAHLDTYRSLYIATPIYHGYGLAMLFLGISLGAELYVTRRFDAARSAALIARHRIEAVTLVPLMLHRMLRLAPGSLASLRCIIAGSALLSPELAGESLAQLGPNLFNLYGTSEAGFSIMATPDVLSRKPAAIGKPLPGVRARIVNGAGQAVGDTSIGSLCIRSAWTASGRGWIATGDLAYRDGEGDIFLCGRVDDMIVSGGENVYPIELERVLLQHPHVETAAAVGIADVEFGQRLKAVVVAKRGAALDDATLLAWLKPRVARYQMPAAVEFRDELPYTARGKLDRRALGG
jgi:acyl-CoA synthetase (AMP-forming)/AMP-acid ligase II